MLLQLSGYTAGAQETTMTMTRLDEFLNECITRDPNSEGLSLDELYGLYISWCGLRGSSPVPDRAFRAGLRAANIGPGRRAGLCPGLTMAGPAACDYIVHREFPLALSGSSAGLGRLRGQQWTPPTSPNAGTKATPFRLRRHHAKQLIFRT
jgi:hypothetical protein